MDDNFDPLTMWPRTFQDLLKSINNSISEYNNMKKDNNITIPYPIFSLLIRCIHIANSENNSDYKIRLEELLNNLLTDLRQNRDNIESIKQHLNFNIRLYLNWSRILKREGLEGWELEEHENMLNTRDGIQSQIEILKLLQEDITESINKIKLSDKLLKSLRTSFEMKNGFDLLDCNTIKIYPVKIYWWWYLGGIRKEVDSRYNRGSNQC